MTDTNTDQVRKTISIPRELWERIEDFRFRRRIGREVEAMRIILETGLAVLEKADARKAKKADGDR